MRGLTKEEAAALAHVAQPVDHDFYEEADPVGLIIRDRLTDQGRLVFISTPQDPEFYGTWSATPLGKLALRVHQLCVERGLA